MANMTTSGWLGQAVGPFESVDLEGETHLDYFDDDGPSKPGGRVYKEFDCPTCDANNPRDDGFRERDEVTCHYCGCVFVVKPSERPDPKLVEA